MLRSNVVPKEVVFIGRLRSSSTEALVRAGWRVHWTANSEAMLEIMPGPANPIVVCDEHLLDSSWRLLLQELAESGKGSAFIVISARSDAGLWAEVINAGGFDILVEPFDHRDLVWILEAAQRSRPCVAVSTSPEAVDFQQSGSATPALSAAG
jgi:DNA-binding NtrC family response regulator